MEGNPYQAAQSPTPAIDRGVHVWPSVVVTGLLVMLTIATAAAFASAAWYRLENTEAFGRRIVPPTIPLQLIDCVLVVTGCLAAVLGAGTIAVLIAFLHRRNDSR